MAYTVIRTDSKTGNTTRLVSYETKAAAKAHVNGMLQAKQETRGPHYVEGGTTYKLTVTEN
ncbi:hypothetical protein [Natronomonas marina]|uniref:hypothetical protein n=1 Tax=Natronomonas marina TaxID=2961939 RepID=UPI0020C9BA10|nr:hypothetical protein [Natronomonas marina]